MRFNRSAESSRSRMVNSGAKRTQNLGRNPFGTADHLRYNPAGKSHLQDPGGGGAMDDPMSHTMSQGFGLPEPAPAITSRGDACRVNNLRRAPPQLFGLGWDWTGSPGRPEWASPKFFCLRLIESRSWNFLFWLKGIDGKAHLSEQLRERLDGSGRRFPA